jgi:predicted permease
MFEIFLKTLAVFLMIFAGYLVRRLQVVDESFNRQLSLLLINLFYPALILSSMVKSYTLDSLAANWTLPAGAATIMCAGWALGRLALPWLRRQPELLRRIFHFDCTMNNYSFLPIMLVAGLLGERAVAQVVFASLGAELVLWTLGVQSLTGHAVSRRTIRNLLTMPMGAIALAVSLLTGRFLLARLGVHAASLPVPAHHVGGMLLNTCQMIGQATIPVSAIICGSRMASLHVDHLFSFPILGIAGMRLLAIPALVVCLISLLPLSHPVKQVLMVIAVQPCSMASVTLAEIYKTDMHFAAAAVLVTHVACLLTIPIWLRFIM